MIPPAVLFNYFKLLAVTAGLSVGFVLAVAAPSHAAASPRGHDHGACDLDMDGDGDFGTAGDCDVCDGDANLDVDEIYVDCDGGDDLSGDGTPGNPYRTVGVALAVTNGPDVGEEDAICVRGTCASELLPLIIPQDGKPTVFTRPADASQNEVRAFEYPDEPFGMYCWDTDNDDDYRSDETCVIDAGPASTGWCIRSDKNHFEMAHLTFKNCGSGQASGTANTNGLFVLDAPERTHHWWHHNTFEAINKDGVHNSQNRVFGYFQANGGSIDWLAIEHNHVPEFAGYFLRGGQGTGAIGFADFWRVKNNTHSCHGCDQDSGICAGLADAKVKCSLTDLWGALNDVEILNNHSDANVLAWAQGAAVGWNAHSCTQGWDIVNNELIDFQNAILIEPSDSRPVSTCTDLARPMDDFHVVGNDIVMRNKADWGGEHLYPVTVARGRPGGIEWETLKTATFTDNTIRCENDSSAGYVFGLHASHDSAICPGGHADGLIEVYNNTSNCDYSQNSRGGIWIGTTGTSGAATQCGHEGYRLRNNIFIGRTARDCVAVEADWPGHTLDIDHQVYDPNCTWFWKGEQHTTLADWQAQPGVDESESVACDPTFVDELEPDLDLHLDPTDACAQGGAETLTTVALVDRDGDPRTFTSDIGSDEASVASQACVTNGDCDDASFCSGTEVCVAGACAGGDDPCFGTFCDEAGMACAACVTGGDCNDDDDCTIDTCTAGACSNTPHTGACDDHLECTTGDVCDAFGVCSGVPVDCSGLDDGCNDGVCKKSNGSCTAVPKPSGTTCDDASLCTSADVCDDGGFCSGTPVVDCSGLDDDCNVGVCVAGSGACTTVERAEGTPCEDGDFCNGNEACDTGACVLGPDPCPGEFCDEVADVCLECLDDIDCDDGVFCNGAETCSAGSCFVGSDPCPGQLCDEIGDVCTGCVNDVDCADGDVCTDDVCSAGICSNPFNTAPCDDGDICTGSDVCNGGGACLGTAPDCSGLDDACNVGVCDGGTGGCVAQPEIDGTSCGDAAFCNGAEICTSGACTAGSDPCAGQLCDESGDVCVDCLADNDCDDATFCNGGETCVAGSCAAGADPCEGQFCDESGGVCADCLIDTDCDDSDVCTTDTCATGACSNVFNTDPCDDGDLCTATDTCDGAGQCAGTAPDCTDFDDECNDGVCDGGTGGCTAQPKSDGTSCADVDFCNGDETCNAGVCDAGIDPCPGQLCDEPGDVCADCLIDTDCDDTDVCTTDTCVAGACDNAFNAAPCDDGDLCTATDTCDGAGQCAGTAPDCTSLDDACNDGVCDGGTGGCVAQAKSDGTDCSDADFCNGDETCTAGACATGSDPCPGQFCDESGDVCADCLSDGDCDDGDFCNGGETCAAGACAAGSDPCPGQLCDETGDVCSDCLIDTDCDDSDVCTADTCVAGACSNAFNTDPCDDGDLCTTVDTCDGAGQCAGATADCTSLDDACNDGVCDGGTGACIAQPKSDGTDCSDGDFCSGAETCAAGLCVTDGDPCPSQFCDEPGDVCADCLIDTDCDDTDVCTTDTCTAGACDNAFNTAPCDDGDLCTTTDTCDGAGQCAGTAPDCSGLDDACNDGVCDGGTGTCIAQAKSDGTDCSDADFCNGDETCATGVCATGSDPCPGQLCDESGDACADCLIDADCDDSDVCTTDACATGACSNVFNTAPCDDGDLCTATDTCDGAGQCAGTAPDCTSLDDACNDGVCDGGTGTCIAQAKSDGTDCGDADFCNGAETCAAGVCAAGSDPCAGLFCDESGDACADCLQDSDCVDLNFCNGAETCVAGACAAGTDPCPGQLCDESGDLCADCLLDVDCDDSDICTTDTCVAGVCSNPFNTDPCSDFDPCTENDVCDGAGQCAGTIVDCTGAGDECNDGVCDEQTGACVGQPMSDGTDCSDGDFCDGDEQCLLGVCSAGTQPCAGLLCDETNDVCLECFVDGDCSDGLFCNGVETCAAGACASGSDPCGGQACDEPSDQCVALGDPDNDGLADGADPCPFDARNRCFGPIAVDAQTGQTIRVNANVSSAECSGDKTDCNGDLWHADFGYNQALKASSCNINGGGEACVIAGIPALFDCDSEETEDLFQCEHSDRNPSPELIYSFDVPDGFYVVNLLFANTYDGSEEVGDRLTHLLVEGELEYENFDQVEAAGGSTTAVVRSVVANVNDGNGLQIEFANLSQNNPAVKAIEVYEAGFVVTTTTTLAPTTTTTLAPPTTTTLPPSTTTTIPPTTTTIPPTTTTTMPPTTTTTMPPVGGDPDNDGLSDGDDPCPFDARNLCYGVPAIDGDSGNAIRINTNVSSNECSGTKTMCNGEVWYADFGYNQAPKGSACNLNGGGEACVITGIVELFGCENEESEDVFQCEHSDKKPNPDLFYDFDLPDGQYLVNLYFADTYTGTTGIGARVFDIYVEGALEYPAFDAVLAAGSNARVVVRSVVVDVVDGNGLSLHFERITQAPAIKAVEVLEPF